MPVTRRARGTSKYTITTDGEMSLTCPPPARLSAGLLMTLLQSAGLLKTLLQSAGLNDNITVVCRNVMEL